MRSILAGATIATLGIAQYGPGPQAYEKPAWDSYSGPDTYEAGTEAKPQAAWNPVAEKAKAGYWDAHHRLDTASYQNTVIDDAENLWVIAFVSPTCGSCHTLAAEWNNLVQETSVTDRNIKFGYVDVNQDTEILNKYCGDVKVLYTPSVLMYGADKTNPVEYSDGYKKDPMNKSFCSFNDNEGFGFKQVSVAESVETEPEVAGEATTDLDAMLAADDAIIPTEEVVATATAAATAEATAEATAAPTAQVKPDINLPEFDKMHMIQLQGLANSVINGDFDIAVNNNGFGQPGYAPQGYAAQGHGGQRQQNNYKKPVQWRYRQGQGNSAGYGGNGAGYGGRSYGRQGRQAQYQATQVAAPIPKTAEKVVEEESVGKDALTGGLLQGSQQRAGNVRNSYAKPAIRAAQRPSRGGQRRSNARPAYRGNQRAGYAKPAQNSYNNRNLSRPANVYNRAQRSSYSKPSQGKQQRGYGRQSYGRNSRATQRPSQRPSQGYRRSGGNRYRQY